MSVAEELHEHAEHAHEPFDKRVAATMAIIAAGLAFVSVLGHFYTTEEIVLQQRAADQWAFSQAKNIRRYESEIVLDLLQAGAAASRSEAVIQKYSSNRERYEKETEQNQEKAREFEAERDVSHHKAIRLHFGEVFLEISIVLASLAILSKRPLLWYLSIVGAAAGALIALTTIAVH